MSAEHVASYFNPPAWERRDIGIPMGRVGLCRSSNHTCHIPRKVVANPNCAGELYIRKSTVSLLARLT